MIGITIGWDWVTGLTRMATEAEVALEGESSDLMANLLDSNLFNIIIILVLLVYLARNAIGETLAKRRAAIIEELETAEKRKQEAIAALADQQQKLAQAQQEAERIKQQAQVNAEKLRSELVAQAEADAQRIRANAEKEVAAEQDRVLSELRRRIVLQALAKAELDIPFRLDPDLQHQLINRNVQLIGN